MGKDQDELITLAWICSYQVSWYKFWAVMPRVGASWDVEAKFLEEFDSFLGGLHTRFSPPRFKSLYDLFGREPGPGKKLVVELLKQTIDWVEEEGDNCTSSDFKEMLVGRSELLRPHSVELGEFRLTIFVQICVLAGVARRGCGVLTKSYPVKERGSYQQLVDCEVKEEDHDVVLELLSSELGIHPHQGDKSECICCESRDGRRHILDALFRGMHLFDLMWDNHSARYKSCVKRYGSREWIPVIGCNVVAAVADNSCGVPGGETNHAKTS